jgi:NAD(P)-dependent dehydrogenase (short-subunit alcohol dehydrogenase family)
MTLSGKVAIVTGSGQGIGKAMITRTGQTILADGGRTDYML